MIDPNNTNTTTCKSHALFLHSLSPSFLILVPIFFAVLVCTFTHYMRCITPGVSRSLLPSTASTTTAATPAARGKRAKIQYDYAKAKDNEIDLVDGQYVEDVEMVTEDWWMGTNTKGERGLFPSSYAELVPAPAPPPPDPLPPAPANTAVDVEAGAGDAPPPYVPSTPATTTAPATVTPTAIEEPAKPKPKRSSAANFVLGTALFVPLISSIVCLGLSIQALIFCSPWAPLGTAARFFYWLFFSFIAINTTFGVSCYAMLVRDLWGPKMKERWPFKEDIIIGGTIMGLAILVAGPFAFVSMGLVKFVEWCQKSWCGDVLVEEGEVELRLVEVEGLTRVEEVHAQAGMEGGVVDGGNGEGSKGHTEDEEHGEDEEPSENAGLITGMQK